MKGDRFINIEAEEGMYRYQLGCQTSSEKVKWSTQLTAANMPKFNATETSDRISLSNHQFCRMRWQILNISPHVAPTKSGCRTQLKVLSSVHRNKYVDMSGKQKWSLNQVKRVRTVYSLCVVWIVYGNVQGNRDCTVHTVTVCTVHVSETVQYAQCLRVYSTYCGVTVSLLFRDWINPSSKEMTNIQE